MPGFRQNLLIHLGLILTTLIASPGFANSRLCLQRIPSPEESHQIQLRQIEQIIVHKAQRSMTLIDELGYQKTFHISLGFAPVGAKRFEGDGKTPEGSYFIQAKNPASAYRLALKISYPNSADKNYARAAKKNPGSWIMIHGFPVDARERERAKLRHLTSADWTEGCVGINDSEIDEIFPLVDEGTPVELCP